MKNLRQKIELDLHESLEGQWKIPIELIGPDGDRQLYSKNNPDELLGGQVLYFSKQENPETGEMIIVDMPVVSLRISSLNRIPQPGEKWYIKMPTFPQANAEKESFTFTPTRSSEHGTDIGFMRIYPQRIENTGESIS